MSLQTSVKERTGNLEETLQLRCPGCNGGLNLRRKHLGITGQCVHCHSFLTAIEEFGSVRVVMGASPVATKAQPVEPAPAPKIEVPAASQELSMSEPPPLSPQWGFPERTPEPLELQAPSTALNAPSPAAEPVSLESSFVDTVTTDFAYSPLDREGDNLFVDRAGIPLAMSQPTPPPLTPSPFDEVDDFQIPFSSLFKVEESPVELNEAWGTKVPQESHASSSPFSTPSSGGGGFAETLFRDKVVKESASDDFTIAIPFSVAKAKEAPAPARHQDCAPKVILDGDGRPLAPMTKEEEEEFAKNFFAMERARGKEPKWRKRLKGFLIKVIVLGLAGMVAFFVTPREKMVEYQTKAGTWLEPGMAILDYLPEGMRPDWLPRTDFGIDAGLDENGKPKPKMNAFEGLEKLKVDIGNMRGAADEELKKLNDY